MHCKSTMAGFRVLHALPMVSGKMNILKRNDAEGSVLQCIYYIRNSYVSIYMPWHTHPFPFQFNKYKLTSSTVSKEPSTFGFALRARRGAVILDNVKVLVGGGPPRGCPLITTVSPDKICIHWSYKCTCTYIVIRTCIYT